MGFEPCNAIIHSTVAHIIHHTFRHYWNVDDLSSTGVCKHLVTLSLYPKYIEENIPVYPPVGLHAHSLTEHSKVRCTHLTLTLMCIPFYADLDPDQLSP